MKANKKGFTLIELLAVIVILAIIALIATPIVLNLIERARKGAAQDAAYGVRKTAQLYYQTALMEEPAGLTNDITITFGTGATNPTITNGISGVDFELDGTKPTAGTITISKTGTITYSGITINNYTCTDASMVSGKVTCEKAS